jgi:predicted MPP superfamily phosphohydrolase
VLVKDKKKRTLFDDSANVGMICRTHCFNSGVIMRAVGDRMIIAPPLVITTDEIDILIERAKKSLDESYTSLKADGLFVAGIEDLWSRRARPATALARWTKGTPGLVLNHNPDALDDQANWLGYDGWVLSGHTHGGQCRSPFITPPILPVRNKRYTSGAIAVGDGRHVYISRGVGFNVQVRFAVRPEITLFTLRRG